MLLIIQREERTHRRMEHAACFAIASGVLGPSLSKRKENSARKRNEPREGMDGTCCLVCCLPELKIVLTQNKR
jgi:hypothetical protein